MAIPTNWHDWDIAIWQSVADDWGDMSFYHTCPSYSNYFLTSNETYVDINHFVAIRLIEDKCDAMQAEIDALGSPAEVNMDAIIEAMWDSDKLRWFKFINYIDAMRGGIWNTQIYETHLQDWYRHFSL